MGQTASVSRVRPPWQSPLSLLAALAVPLVVLAVAIRVLASQPFLEWEYGRPGFPDAPGISGADRLALAAPPTLYVVGGSTMEELAALEAGEQPLFSEGEIAHVEDVRQLVAKVTSLALVGLVVAIAGAVLWLARRYRGFPRAVERGGWLTMALVALVALMVGAAWPWFFVTFHELLFRPGTWQFADDSGLIRLFPERFWYDTATVISLLSLLGGAAAVVSGRLMRRIYA